MPKASIKFPKWYQIYIIVTVTILLFLGGIDHQNNLVVPLAIVTCLLILILGLNYRQKVFYPKHFNLYLVFLAALLLSNLFSLDKTHSFYYLQLFISAGLFWLVSYNLKPTLINHLDKIILCLGIIFSSITLLAHQLNLELFKFTPFGFTGYLSKSMLDHHRLADFWILIVTLSFTYLLGLRSKYKLFRSKPFNTILITVGLAIIVWGLSRTAIVAVISGVLYYTHSRGMLSKYQKLINSVLLIFTALFLYTSQFKSVFSNRQYYLQGLAGYVKRPILGYGLGNFGVVSIDRSNHLFGLDGFSSLAFNLPLEIMIGMGLLGLSFLYWAYKALISSLSINQNRGHQALLVAISVSFFFDATYFIPTMLWLWFILLGLLSQNRTGR